MKSLKEQLNESTNVNESVLGAAGGVIAGLIGFTVVKSVVKGLVTAGAEIVFNHEYKKMEKEYIPRMESLLEKYPKSYKWAKNFYDKNSVQELLDRTDGTLGQTFFIIDIFREDDWSDEDKKEFEKLWERSATINSIMRKKLSEALWKGISK